MKLFKKFWEITAELAFTFAGSAVVLITLSGQTRKMALIATISAISVHYIHELLKGDDDA